VTDAGGDIEAIRRIWDNWAAAFAGEEDGFLEGMAPDVEWVPIMAVLEGRVFHGHEGLRRWLEDLRRDWEAFDPQFEEFRDLGDGSYLVLGQWQARTRSSGVELTQPASWLIRMRDGKVARLQTFTDRQEAIEVSERLRSSSA
jgi:ketosteroid isomerase-like protein